MRRHPIPTLPCFILVRSSRIFGAAIACADITPATLSAWTSHLLDSPLALDPMIGREAIKVIDCFLDVRRAALPRQKAIQAANDDGQGESQDDFGTFDDLDFDDPTLNAMLGIEGDAAGVGGGDDALRSADKACAEVSTSQSDSSAAD